MRSTSTRTRWTRSLALFGACRAGRYSYDPGKARHLLRQASADGVTVMLGSPQGRCMGDSQIAPAVAAHLRAYWPPAGRAGSSYDSAAVDQLVASANQGRDAHDRQRAYCDAQKAIWDDAPWIFLHYPKLPVVTTAGVVGVTMLPNERFDTVYARPT